MLSKLVTKMSHSWYFLPILMGLFQSTLIAATPLFISTTGLSTMSWSMLVSMPTLFFLLLSPRWGRWADRRGASFIIRYAATGLGLSMVLLALVWWLGLGLNFSPAWWFIAIAVSRVVYGLSASGVMPICQSLAIDSAAKDQGQEQGQDRAMRNLGFVSASLSIGRFVGPAILMAVASQIDWLLGLYCVVALVIVCSVWSFSQKVVQQRQPRTGARPGHPKANDDSIAEETINNPAKARLGLFFALALSITMFVGFLQFTLGPLYLDWLTDAESATRNMSLTLSIVAVTALICQLFIVKRLNWQTPWVLLVLGAVLLLAVLGFARVSSTLGVMVCIIPVAVSLALITPVYSRFAMALAEASKGQISGQLAVAHTAGYPVGSLLAGLLYTNPSSWWWPLLALSLVVFVLCILVVIRASQLKKEASYST